MTGFYREGGVTSETRYYPYCNECGGECLVDDDGFAREESAEELFLEHMREVHEVKYDPYEGKFIPV